ncbi:MAG: SGNH/GDSL hydrolase family protein, partial [Verrucomicrobiota bacterium]
RVGPLRYDTLLMPTRLIAPIAMRAANLRIERVRVGDLATVPNFLAKVETEKKAHIAFLGGSITQQSKGHVSMVPAWLREQYPDCEFTVTNAGLSSTCSVSGAFRFKDHVLAKGDVDLLVFEYAVNDDQDGFHSREQAMRSYEGIIRQFRTANPDGEALCIMYVNENLLKLADEGKESVSIDAHKTVARHYNLANVDIAMALSHDIKAGNNSWEQYGGVHPNKVGYRFATDQIIEVFKRSSSDPTGAITLPEALNPNHYGNARFVGVEDASWLGGWTLGKANKELMPLGGVRKDYTSYTAIRADEPGSMLYFNFTGKMVGAFVMAGPDAGAVEVSIDGGEWKTVELYHKYSKGLNYPRSVVFADGMQPKYHQLALRTRKSANETSQGAAATILFFEVN